MTTLTIAPFSPTLNLTIKPGQVRTYIDLPFEVAPGANRIEIAYRYDGMVSSDPTIERGNTIDIGIFDPRGAGFMGAGFRGWSGSARQQFFIAQDDATPGYIAGPIQPGTWTICLGAYKVAPEGCQCQVDIRVAIGDAPLRETAAFPRLLPMRTSTTRPRNPDHWYKGDIHCHSVHSDGDSTIPEILQIARDACFDFLAITDHNTRSHLAELATINEEEAGLVLIPGYEVTTNYGHWNIWGDAEWIDFRITDAAHMDEAIRTAHRLNYVVSCNHPRPYGPPWSFTEVEGYETVEVWNGPWEFLNEISLSFWVDHLNRGKHLTAVGGSDFHFSKEPHPAQLGHPTVYIHCEEEPNAANLLRHLKAGHAFISESPKGPRLELTAAGVPAGDTLSRDATHLDCMLIVTDGIGCVAELHSLGGVIASYPITEAIQTVTHRISTDVRLYIRVQLVDQETGKVRALTNSVYLKPMYVG